ncbi:MAG TPA: hypothetical protein IAB65_06290 [Candidatus Onthocola stercorigallinarum]|nr:hypothetical protein [Candidatus Onthocola stercorigallinarum]
MDIDDLKTLVETDIWQLYEKHAMYMRNKGYYSATDRNFRFFNGNQWDNAIVGKNVELIQINYIKPIVKYKVGVVTSTNYAIIYNSDNFEPQEFRTEAKRASELLTKEASKIWEKNKLDYKLKKAVRKAAINGEIISYWYWDEEIQMPKTELKSKVDVMYGNENDDDIQNQPYILIKRRSNVINAREYARSKGVKEEEILNIHGDNFTQDESGDSSKDEVDDMTTIVTFLYKKDGTIHFSESVKYVTITKDQDTGLTYYPVAHLNWEDCEGNARGIGEVEQHIDNQIEVNKTATRRAFIAKSIAYPYKVVNEDKIQNPEALNKVGSTIRIKDGSVEDISKYFRITNPGTISPDIANLQNELISVSRELAGAGDMATGQIQPDEASGKAILAVQRASEQPLNEQSANVLQFIEDIGLIIFDMLKTYSDDLMVVDESTDAVTGEVVENLVIIPKQILETLKLNIKIDVTPKSAFDKYAQESSIENLTQSQLFLPQNQQLLEDYVSLLDDDSTMPKSKLLDLLKRRKERSKAIEQMELQAQQLKAQAQQNIANQQDIEAISQMGNQMINQATQM